MGDFSSVCAISNLPITRYQQIVAIPLEPYRWASESGKLKYVPTGFPSFGEYDYSGGIEGTNICHTDHALIHRKVWDNAEMYWHHLNQKSGTNDWLFTSREIERVEKEKKSSILCDMDRDWTDSDYLYHSMRHQFTTSNYGLTFRNLIVGKNVSAAGDKKENCFLERNSFMEAIITKILDKTWTDKDQDDVNRIVWLWGGQMIFGHNIRPSGDIWVEQYPEYKQRIKLNIFHGKLVRKLQKELNS